MLLATWTPKLSVTVQRKAASFGVVAVLTVAEKVVLAAVGVVIVMLREPLT